MSDTDQVNRTVLDILRREEGTRKSGGRHVVYDDATGNLVVPGYVMKGHPTVGVGRALDVNGLSDTEADYLLMNDVEGPLRGVPRLVSNWSALSVNRKAVLICMAFQMGLDGLAGFKNTLADISRSNFTNAAARMLQSLWAKQTPERAKRMAELMRKG